MSCSLEGACAPRNRRRVAPHLRWEGAKMADLHYMEMGWSGSGWMDPLPMERPPLPSPTPASTPAEEPKASVPASKPTRKAAKKAAPKKAAAKKAAKKKKP